MGVYATGWFWRWMRQHRLLERDLCRAVSEMARGLIDADLGGGLVKKRIPKIGQGKRGGFRTIVAKPKSVGWFFIYGFAKSERENISAAKEADCRDAADCFHLLSREERARRVDVGLLFEVNCHAQDSHDI
ncbi:type II toxin-antitoxin system RelE/ParE family toxin [Roseateles sp. So40a]|uniref:type II toxin-antitoxin system RelE/ParE family toxin n=1 Tax=Roseateles sp. So40a TaxID=3400226 RepID=UPI003A86DFFD